MFGNPLPPNFLNFGVWSTLLNFGLLLPINPIIVWTIDYRVYGKRI